MNTDSTNLDPFFELERLQHELASRQSVVHFAHTAVSLFVATLLGGAAGKQSWDLPEDKLYLAIPLVSLSLGLAVYACIRYLLGKKARAAELKRFEVLKSLRRRLNLDDPSALLPR